jgi:hypothetical protein
VIESETGYWIPGRGSKRDERCTQTNKGLHYSYFSSNIISVMVSMVDIRTEYKNFKLSLGKEGRVIIKLFLNKWNVRMILD